jgi:tRNA-uridine 2-sulfurtransferase
MLVLSELCCEKRDIAGTGMARKRKIKGIGLLSGGLDSILAIKVLQEQDLDLLGVTFTTPFFGPESALAAGRKADIPVEVVDIFEPHLAILRNPRYGFGRYMNPCIDCHGLMLQEAGRLLKTHGADFLFTGEVLGQRPMSQRRDAMRSVEKLSGMEGLILRPLSAKLLPPTLVELDGRVDRGRLMDIHGRSRKRQIELATRYRIYEYPNPAGGCLLTKEGFVRKLKDLLVGSEPPGRRDLELLRRGRHFRLPSGNKCVVGRNQSDNARLEALIGLDWVRLQVLDHPGPLALVPQSAAVPVADLVMTARILAAYCDAPMDSWVTVEWQQRGRCEQLSVTKESLELFKNCLI